MILGNSSAIQIRNTFEIGDSVFYTLSNDSSNKLYSLKITLQDFTKEPFPIYVQSTIFNINTLIFTSISIIFVLLLAWFLLRRKNSGNPILLLNKNSESEVQNAFSIIEMNLIEQIISCNEKGINLSGEQLNNILGVSKKSIETQKKVRGDTINRINYKFKTLFEREIDIIERSRIENDRRFYNYIISKENATIYKEKFKLRN